MKHIVIFADGTCNESDKGYATNVRKLYQMVERRTKRQLAFYDPGVGTNFYKVTGAAFGVGISKNIQECYDFIVDYYRPGDRIFLFGFSRGAYTVRSLGGMIRKTGILKREYRKLTDEAFDLYKAKENDAEAKRFKADFCWPETDEAGRKTDVYFIGVWDTVSALGIPLTAVRSLNPFSRRLYGFHDAKLSPDVPYGYQALSIDDERKIFRPEIWDESEKSAEQTIEQVWFAGVHSNVGGGYRRSGLSDITLHWMVKKAVDAGLLLWEDHDKKVLTYADPDGKLYDSRSGLGRIYLKKVRPIPQGARIHKTVFERIGNAENLYDPAHLPDDYRLWDDDGEVNA
jgi:uncharacterized protein (DUF2235 family)